MFMHDNPDGSKTVILDVGDKPLTVELPGGNGEYFRVFADGTLLDQDGTDMRRAYY
jgi:hypothetical protein